MSHWSDSAACKTMTDLFYPQRGDNDAAAAAKAVCRRCPVKVQCLDFAMTFEESEGIWGGTSGYERRQLRRAQWASFEQAKKHGHGLMATWRDGCRCESCTFAFKRQDRRRDHATR